MCDVHTGSAVSALINDETAYKSTRGATVLPAAAALCCLTAKACGPLEMTQAPRSGLSCTLCQTQTQLDAVCCSWSDKAAFRCLSCKAVLGEVRSLMSAFTLCSSAAMSLQ